MKQVLDTISHLEKEKAEWLKKVESIEITIKTLRQSLGVPQNGATNGASKSASENYDKTWSHKNKILFFLKSEQRFLHITEMAQLAHAFEPGTRVDGWQNKISPALSALKKEGKVVNITEGKSLRNTFWGSPKWLGNDGQVISGHEFNRDLLFEPGSGDGNIEI
jgi:hypothetical protein